MLMKPKKAERRPWEMFFIGLFYASVSFLLVWWFFSKDSVLREGSGLLMVIFTVMCCLPFMYYIIKLEEGKDIEIDDSGRLIKEHSKALYALMWMFLGFVVAFSVWYIVFPDTAGQNFNFQIKTFCAINSPLHYSKCIDNHGVPLATGAVTGMYNFFAIFSCILFFSALFPSNKLEINSVATFETLSIPSAFTMFPTSARFNLNSSISFSGGGPTTIFQL